MENNRIGPAPVRISAYSVASFTGEGFAYVLTRDIGEYYNQQPEFYLAMDDAVTSANIELA